MVASANLCQSYKFCLQSITEVERHRDYEFLIGKRMSTHEKFQNIPQEVPNIFSTTKRCPPRLSDEHFFHDLLTIGFVAKVTLELFGG